MTSPAAVPPAPSRRRAFAVVTALVALSLLALPPDLTILSSAEELAAAWRRVAGYLSAFLSPDLSGDVLQRCARLAADTVAVALLGVAFGLVLAYPLAIGACRAVVVGDRPSWWRLALLEVVRFVLDVLRGVPDFVWAIVLASVTGVNAVTGLLAIAVSVGGIFGKVLSEQWDNVPGERYAAVRSTGAGALSTFLYGLQPLGARVTLSFVLMRTECAVRNASVIGVVGGGGLGAGLWDAYEDADWSVVSTMMLALLAVTALADLSANVVRRRLRVDPDHPRAPRASDVRGARRRRAQVLAAVALTLAGCALWLRAPIADVAVELGRVDWSFVGGYLGGLFVPDASLATLGDVARASAVPLAIGVLATLSGAALAALLVYPASVAFQVDSARFTGERASAVARALRVAVMAAARAVALVLRAVPEAAWLVVLLVLFRLGPTPCVVAVALHTAGVLHRVFTEAVDDVRYQQLERAGAGRARTFLYAALPRAAANWRSYLFFQFEVNMRAGIALGVIGAGGLGDLFETNLEWREHARASSFLWGMIALTVLVDRLSRWLQLPRRRC